MIFDRRAGERDPGARLQTFAARVCLALAFLIACASSRMTKRQAMSLSGAIRSSEP